MGDWFLNFNLHPEISNVCGIDLRHYRSDDDGHPLNHPGVVLAAMVWIRCTTGLKSSLHYACKAMSAAEEVIF